MLPETDLGWSRYSPRNQPDSCDPDKAGSPSCWSFSAVKNRRSAILTVSGGKSEGIMWDAIRGGSNSLVPRGLILARISSQRKVSAFGKDADGIQLLPKT